MAVFVAFTLVDYFDDTTTRRFSTDYFLQLSKIQSVIRKTAVRPNQWQTRESAEAAHIFQYMKAVKYLI